jgi:RHH-type proline utilization regulon transcriptional repressor/proline dehydrogenase/delta 1-pyrroline-5-carboxylate dehydrogenase
MAIDARITGEVDELADRLRKAAEGQPPLALTPAWFQQRLLDWATRDPDFRTKLLRFVDVLPALRSAGAIADHVRQYFRHTHQPLVDAASGAAGAAPFRPVLSRIVRQGVFAMAGRFIAGETPAEALDALRSLAKEGVGATVDLLGEETLSDAEADAYLARYTDLVGVLSSGASGLSLPQSGPWTGVPPVNISIKLSALCAHMEPAAPDWVSASAMERLRPLGRAAAAEGAFLNLDMEQYRYRDLAHTAFAAFAGDPEFARYPHLGIVVQAYLRDAEDDIQRLAELAKSRGEGFSVRLVKGAYWDEEQIAADQNSWPVPVYTEKEATDESFERCTDALLAAYPLLRPAFGTHNPESVAQAIIKARDFGLPSEAVEFQVLFGMAEGLRREVAEMGYRTRVYVPVGRVIPGMAYLVRRLLENTSNQAWFNAGGGAPVAAGQSLQPPRHAAGDLPAHGLDAVQNAPPAQFFVPSVRQSMTQALDARRSRFGREYPLLVGDREVARREQSAVTYPAEPETMIGFVAQANREDVEAAVSEARRAYPSWRETSAHERSTILRRAADIIESRRFELAALMVYESAKPWHEADGDVCEAVDYLRYYSAQAELLEEPRPMGRVPGERNEYFHQGRGVAAIIAPWNFPLAIICGMATGAIAGGNSAILKPAAQSPLIAYEFTRILREAGVPPGVIQYLPGPGGEIGQALVEHPLVDIVAFTGSSSVGLAIIESAARPHPGQLNVKRVIAEMGGKNAVVIDEDADLDQAIGGAVSSAFGYAGQKCSACSRLVVVGSAYDEALSRLKHAIESLVVGPPHDPATLVPPVISETARRTIEGYIDGAMKGSTLFARGRAGPGNGHYVAPTVFTGVPRDSALAREEVFGPVLAVFRAKTFGEALDIASDSSFALTGGLFSRNPRNIEHARRCFLTGNLYINRKITGAVAARQPFGGMRMSGIGEKAGGPDYVRQFMEPRTVTENTMRRGFAPEDGA